MAELRTGTLTVELLSFWHAGGGVAGNYGADAVVRKEDGLPIVPGRHLLGLMRHELKFVQDMRDTLTQAKQPIPAALEVVNPAIIDALFGVSGDRRAQGRFDSTPGVLFIDSAQLPEAWRRHLAATPRKDRPEVVAPLYRRFGMTAIDPKTGTAKDRTLRHIEVTVPMTLTARISLDGARYTKMVARHSKAPSVDQLTAAVTRAAGMVQHLGRHRTRGLGRARLSVAWEGQQ